MVPTVLYFDGNDGEMVLMKPCGSKNGLALGVRKKMQQECRRNVFWNSFACASALKVCFFHVSFIDNK